jgi:hypothetical protein
MPKQSSAKAHGVRRIHPTADDHTQRDTESPSPPARLSPAASNLSDLAQRGAGPRRVSLNSVGSAHSDSSKDEGKSPGIPSSLALAKRRTSINSLTSIGSDDSDRKTSHFSEKVRATRTKSLDRRPSMNQNRKMALDSNFKVPAILLLSSKLFNAIYVTSKKMFVMAVLSVVMCVVENEIWFSVYLDKENVGITDASKLVLSKSQKFNANICKAVLSFCTALLCFYITVYYKELLELKKLKQSDLDSVMQDQTNFFKSGLVYWYLLEMIVCLVHIPYGVDMSVTIEFRSILAFYRGEMIVTLVIFMRLYHVVRVIRDWTLIRFKNAVFLSKLVHVEQGYFYALKVLLHENPVAFVLCGLASTLLLFGYLLRTYDTTARPVVEGFGLSQAYWISLLSLTTVGYGDDVPKSHLGRIMVVMLVYIGSILIPLQIAIVERLLQFNIQEDRMIRVYRVEQRRHAFEKAAVQLVVSWYRSIKAKKTNKLGNYIERWKKFRLSHASNLVHNSLHNEADKNVVTVASALTTSIHELTLSVSKQTTESQDLSRRCIQNMQCMQLIADRFANLLHNVDNTDQIKSSISASQHALHSSQKNSRDSKQHLAANSMIKQGDARQQQFSKISQSTDEPPVSLGQDVNGFVSSVDAEPMHSISMGNPEEQLYEVDPTQVMHLMAASKSSLGNNSSAESVGNEPKTLAASHRIQGSIMMPASPQISGSAQSLSHNVREPISSHSLDAVHQQDFLQSVQMKDRHPASPNILSIPPAVDNFYSSAPALAQMPSEASGRNVQNSHHPPIQQQRHQISQQNNYYNQSADAAFSRSETAPEFVESDGAAEGFYPPPHNYSPEAIQFHRDRIYEQARPSLNSILRSSPGLIPPSDAARLRPATYYSSKSPPVPLLTRPNSPGPKGFTPVRVKPFNPQGVISPLQGLAPAGSSSAYAKFLLTRSEYKPESLNHSP